MDEENKSMLGASIPEMQITLDKVKPLCILYAATLYRVPKNHICNRCFRVMQPVGYKRELLCVHEDGFAGCDDPPRKEQ
jgi:hypothetical protein